MALLTKEQLRRLREIIQDASNALAVSAFGYDLPDEELQRLIDEGWLSEAVEKLVDDAYKAGVHMAEGGGESTSLEAIRRAPPPKLSDIEQRAMGIATDRAGQYVVGLGNRWSERLGRIVVDADQQLAQDTRDVIKDETARAVIERRTYRELATSLGKLTEDWGRDWDRIAFQEIQTAHQEGYFEATIERYGDEELMARVPDPGACPICRRLYLDADGKPIVRSMEWWLEQGSSNIGRKQADWKPVYGPIHVWCRCVSTRVPKGMEIDEDGVLEPIEKSLAADMLRLTDDLRKGGPYIGPRGGKWADPRHTIPWKEHKRTGVIRVDPAAVHRVAEEMVSNQKWHPRREQLVNPGRHVDSHSTTVETKDARGKAISVRVIMRSAPDIEDVRGVSGSHIVSGRPGDLTHTVFIDVASKAWQRNELGEALRSVLAHELVHASDPGIVARAKPGQRKSEAGVAAYYNKPSEVAARLQQIYRELNTPAVAKEAVKRGSGPGLVEDLAGRQSETWYAIEEHLTPKNRKRVLKEISRLIVRHVEGTSEPIEKSLKSDREYVPSVLEGHKEFANPKLKWRGLTIRLENEEGDIRGWYDANEARSGYTLMLVPYGYIEGTQGADGDEVDVYVGRNPGATHVFVIDQRRAPDFKEFDEQKVMVGFSSRAEAVRAYLAQYDDPRFLGGVKPMKVEEFVRKVKRTTADKLIKSSSGPLRGVAFHGPAPAGNVVSGGMKIGDPQHASAHVIDATAVMEMIEEAAKTKSERSRLVIDLQRFHKLETSMFQPLTPPQSRPKQFGDWLLPFPDAHPEAQDNRRQVDELGKRAVKGQKAAREVSRWTQVKR